MNNKELINILQRAKDAPTLGGGFDVDQAWDRFASTYAFPKQVESHRYGWRDYVNYIHWHAGRGLMRPFAVGLSAFAIAIGGWVATVNASFDSVPGDILYPVKLATERVQLTFATSNERRAKLHTEFATRRLEEVSEISHSDRDEKDERVKEAVEGFKQELASANQQLEEVQTSPAEATAIAIAIDQKTDEYAAVISQTPVVSDESQQAVTEAFKAVEETSSQAIDSLVQSHETAEETVTAEQTAQHLQTNFQQQYEDIRGRIAMSLGRLDVVKSVLAKSDLDVQQNVDYGDQVEEAREALMGNDKLLVEAMDTLAAGGYRRAFEILDEVDAKVSQSEQIITDLEITISTAIAAGDAEAAPIEMQSEPTTAPDAETDPTPATF